MVASHPVHRDIMGIELLLVVEGIEVRFDCQWNNTWRVVGKILLKQSRVDSHDESGSLLGQHFMTVVLNNNQQVSNPRNLDSKMVFVNLNWQSLS
jgi:hypothetical protein